MHFSCRFNKVVRKSLCHLSFSMMLHKKKNPIKRKRQQLVYREMCQESRIEKRQQSEKLTSSSENGKCRQNYALSSLLTHFFLEIERETGTVLVKGCELKWPAAKKGFFAIRKATSSIKKFLLLSKGSEDLWFKSCVHKTFLCLCCFFAIESCF